MQNKFNDHNEANNQATGISQGLNNAAAHEEIMNQIRNANSGLTHSASTATALNNTNLPQVNILTQRLIIQNN